MPGSLEYMINFISFVLMHSFIPFLQKSFPLSRRHHRRLPFVALFATYAVSMPLRPPWGPLPCTPIYPHDPKPPSQPACAPLAMPTDKN